jgi:catechol 2,3-dioxygenase-like lactoylglutathione lyase family enzyme
MMRLHHGALVSSSEAHADKFYGGILKLRKIKSASLSRDLAAKIFDLDLECQFILYGSEDMAIEVFVTDRITDKAPTLIHLCLEVEDREEFAETCRENGLEVNLIPRGETQLCFVRDFDGNIFEIKQQRKGEMET